MTRAYQSGMTLLEILVALTIFVLIATAGYAGLQQGLVIQDSLQQKRMSWRRLDSVLMLIQQDLDQARDLAPRQPSWDAMAFRGATDDHSTSQGELLLFTRGGHVTFREGPVSPYLRLAYRLRDGTLYRVIWPRLNLPIDEEGVEEMLLDDVAGIRLRYLDTARQWIANWPLVLNPENPLGLPRAVELTLELEDHTSYKRVFHVGAPD